MPANVLFITVLTGNRLG